MWYNWPCITDVAQLAMHVKQNCIYVTPSSIAYDLYLMIMCKLWMAPFIMVGFYIVNFFLLFLNKSQEDPTFGFYNLAHSDVTVFHSFK